MDDVETTPGAAVVVEMQVENSLIPAAPITVHARSGDSSNMEVLGTIDPAETESFSYTPTGLRTESFELIAETSSGHLVTSSEFTLAGVEGVMWDVSPNSLTFNR